MDYDHPYRQRRASWPAYGIVRIIGSAAFVWSVGSALLFWQAIHSHAATDFTAKVVDYEVAGGKNRLRVQLYEGRHPRGFSLLSVPFLGGGFPPGYELAVAIREPDTSALEFGRQITVYDIRANWTSKAIIAAVSLLLIFLGTRARQRGKPPHSHA